MGVFPGTVLQIINTAQAELGLPQSQTIVGNTDPTTIQMFALLNLAAEELRDYSDEGWKALQFEFNLIVNAAVTTTGDLTENSAVITNIPDTSGLAANFWAVSGPGIPQAARIASVDSATQITMTMVCTGTAVGAELVFGQDTYNMPSDFRKYTNRTWWDRTNQWELLGPDSAQVDQWHRSGIVATGPRRHFRNIGPYAKTYRLWPPPMTLTEPIQLVYEYITTNIVAVHGSQTVFSDTVENDDDTFLLDARALVLSIKWRFWEQKGFNWLSKRKEYDDYVDRLMARDGGAETLSLVRTNNNMYLSPADIQDTNFPGPGNSGSTN